MDGGSFAGASGFKRLGVTKFKRGFQKAGRTTTHAPGDQRQAEICRQCALLLPCVAFGSTNANRFGRRDLAAARGAGDDQ